MLSVRRRVREPRMPSEPDHIPREVDPPKGSFLGIWTTQNTINPLPNGTVLAIVGDASDPSTIVPLVLQKASIKRIVASCACGDPKCSLIITFTASRQGSHPRR